MADRPAADEPCAETFYADALRALAAAKVPHLVGGGYAFAHFTHIDRPIKDLDVFVRQQDLEPALRALEGIGCRSEITFHHWLGKAIRGDHFVDVIYSSGNGIAVVDEEWFKFAPETEVLGVPVRVIPAEEMIWSKSFVMERERCDAADVLHLLRGAERLDWGRLARRFGPHYRVLYCYLILFGFVYPSDRAAIPEDIMRDFAGRLAEEQTTEATNRVCQGTLLSRGQFLVDLVEWGYQDARLDPSVHMTTDDIFEWTFAPSNGSLTHGKAEGQNHSCRAR